MKFNIYGRFQLEVRRENESWVVYRVEMGKRARFNDVVVPSAIEADDIAIYLDDISFFMSARAPANVSS